MIVAGLYRTEAAYAILLFDSQSRASERLRPCVGLGNAADHGTVRGRLQANAIQLEPLTCFAILPNVQCTHQLPRH